MSERILELIIASTPHEEFRRDLIGKEKGYAIAQILKEGRKFEAMMADRDQLQQMEKGLEDIHFIRKEIKYQNCGRNHKPRKCPAYNDECRLCGKRGHWEKCSPTKRSPSEKQYQRKLYQKKRSHYQGQGSHNQGRKTIDAVEYETDGETYEPTFYSITVSNKCLDSVMPHGDCIYHT